MKLARDCIEPLDLISIAFLICHQQYKINYHYTFHMAELNLIQAEEKARQLFAAEIAGHLGESVIELGFRIRAVEMALLAEFQKGKIAGTIHTCIGQELSPAIISEYLNKHDFLTSNHRCHGHFIAKTKNWKGLVLEILGSRHGVCRGVGSSQHLYAEGFLSNGPQGSLLPVGTGISNWMKSNNSDGIAISFIGEGTLGEGITHEAMNMAAVTRSPQLFVCENNYYSQSTKQSESVSGEILKKPAAFGIRHFSCNIWELEQMDLTIKEALDYVRETKLPGFLLIQCYRIMAHSKGDDDRELLEIETFSALDPLSQLMKSSPPHKRQYEEILGEVKEFIEQHSTIENLQLSEYAISILPTKFESLVHPSSNSKIRTVEAIRNSLESVTEEGGFLIGEDICDPYGGAFKATRGISSKFPDSVLNSPISEAALVGFAIGRALMGQDVIAEIMFGDFITYAFDQIVSNASKFYHVYGIHSGIPLIIRVPSGGHRGYGPTHSQSIEKHLLGIDNILVLAISSLADPGIQYKSALKLKVPTIAIENKIGYSRMLFQNGNSLVFERSSDGLGVLVIKSRICLPQISIITYGELARDVVDQLVALEAEFGVNIEVLCLLQLHPIPLELLLQRDLGALTIVAEEGSQAFGLGAEIGSLLLERSRNPVIFRRVSAEPFPIASNRSLEEQLLANISKIVNVIKAEIRNVK